MGSLVLTVKERGSYLASYLFTNTTMCRPVIKLSRDWTVDHSIDQNCLKKARRVVKKYKKMTLKKEMKRLRQLLPRGETLKQYEVLDQTILLIQQLEMRLLTRIKQDGVPPKIAMVMKGNFPPNLDVNMLRSVVMQTMQKRS